MKKALARFIAVTAIGSLLLAGAGPAQGATLRERVAKLERQVKTLRKKAQALTTSGYYFGYVHGSQVFLLGDEGSDNCAPGNASWVSDPNFPADVMLACDVSASMSADAQAGNSGSGDLAGVVARRHAQL